MAVLNGRLPALSLTKVGARSNGDKVARLLAGDTAKMWLLFVRLMWLGLGVRITLIDAYRNLAEQKSIKAAWTKRGKPQMAATPGYSNHGWGKAVDITQLQNKAWKYYAAATKLLALLGFILGPNEKRLGEWWHRDFTGKPKRKQITVGSTGPEVWLWQLVLRSYGYNVKLDSSFGRTTRSCTIALQKRFFPGQKKQWDGIVGPKSWGKAGL